MYVAYLDLYVIYLCSSIEGGQFNEQSMWVSIWRIFCPTTHVDHNYLRHENQFTYAQIQVYEGQKTKKTPTIKQGATVDVQ